MASPGPGDRAPGEAGGSGRARGDRDVRRFLVGLLFMAALVGVTLAASFLMGRPAPGTDVAPGVPVLAGSGVALVVAAAVVFYRTYRGQ